VQIGVQVQLNKLEINDTQVIATFFRSPSLDTLPVNHNLVLVFLSFLSFPVPQLVPLVYPPHHTRPDPTEAKKTSLNTTDQHFASGFADRHKQKSCVEHHSKPKQSRCGKITKAKNKTSKKRKKGVPTLPPLPCEESSTMCRVILLTFRFPLFPSLRKTTNKRTNCSQLR